MLKILILEDDELFLETLEDFLSDEGFEVKCAIDGEEVLDYCFEEKYDLYLLDINVPKISGIELLKRLREANDTTPTIYLTSHKDKDMLTKGFLSGCDDYLKKPVDLDELLLRINSLLKRSGKFKEEIFLKDELVFDVKNRRLLKAKEDLNLTSKVIDLLELFLEKKDCIVTKEMIISRLWNYNEDYSEGSIRVYINNLKKIFGKDTIKNLKGIGYKFEL
ncbi:response regulator transcription factor [Halarcobacter bivalviorum]|uniref:DNA-binding response regulator n=1 Tax=Halarcobacter bivalviorum TaxID=663364 RepID=A0AAX2ABQ8_9BACT|nr:response regulator transcription factor [Halarcobacter bivalviorum]AXH12234.1 two-component system response regulator [Halarcobacter bivalviorum]RXK11340.1 DNA-binding response regulator [Halarcobacter bivalviorum]